MREINLLESFYKPNRKIEKGWRTEENKIIAKRFGKEFFDGDRINGYGGYYYDGRWKKIVKKLQELYGINSKSSILDIGCGKGFLLYDLQDMIPGIKIAGIDISNYAINHAMDKFGDYTLKELEKEIVKDLNKDEEQKVNDYLKKLKEKIEKEAKEKVNTFMIEGSADKLPWPDNSFDVVLSINTSHNLSKEKLKKSIHEMDRVCKPGGHKFIQLDSWRNDEEKERMLSWSITAKTMMSDKEWIEFLKECEYNGDYFWTIV